MSPRAKQNEKRVSSYISTELFEQLKTEAKEKGINVSILIRMILLEHKNEKG
ncbi:MAG: BrnA antitoxin family protein [Eubacterium sp.]|jgi:predicted DNA binding CopG/RHH family protein|nr:BrnA antitoxin family protein [Eubacterium sp.]